MAFLSPEDLQTNESLQQILNRTRVLMDEVTRAEGNQAQHEQAKDVNFPKNGTHTLKKI